MSVLKMDGVLDVVQMQMWMLDAGECDLDSAYGLRSGSVSSNNKERVYNECGCPADGSALANVGMSPPE